MKDLRSPTRVKISLPEVPIPAKNQKKAAEWNPPNRQADLGTHCSNHMVVVWLQQLEPGWCQLAKTSVAVVPYSGGAPDRVPALAGSPVSISSRALLFLLFCFIIPSVPRQRPRGYGRMTMSSLIPPVGVGAAPSQSRHKKLKCDRQVNSDRGCSPSFR